MRAKTYEGYDLNKEANRANGWRVICVDGIDGLTQLMIHSPSGGTAVTTCGTFVASGMTMGAGVAHEFASAFQGLRDAAFADMPSFIAWLDGLHVLDHDGVVDGGKWLPAQRVINFLKNEDRFQLDSPSKDGRIDAHPAWRRGNLAAWNEAQELVADVLGGMTPDTGRVGSPWHVISTNLVKSRDELVRLRAVVADKGLTVDMAAARATIAGLSIVEDPTVTPSTMEARVDGEVAGKVVGLDFGPQSKYTIDGQGGVLSAILTKHADLSDLDALLQAGFKRPQPVAEFTKVKFADAKLGQRFRYDPVDKREWVVLSHGGSGLVADADPVSARLQMVCAAAITPLEANELEIHIPTPGQEMFRQDALYPGYVAPVGNFEEWAIREGLSVALARDMACSDGRFPSTYWDPAVETAWRAWANKPSTIATPDFEAIKDKRMSELSPEQQRDAKEAWLRANAGWFVGDSGEHIKFLLERLEEARTPAK
jgi:hypothetical protein